MQHCSFKCISFIGEFNHPIFSFLLYTKLSFQTFSSSLQSSIRAILIVHKVCLAYACNLNLSSCGEYSMLYGITDLLCTLPVLPLNLTTALRFSRKAFKTGFKIPYISFVIIRITVIIPVKIHKHILTV